MADYASSSDTSTSACPFCAIVAAQLSAHVIQRWPDAIAFAPLRPATLGHTLVIPTAHVETVWDLDIGAAQRLTARTLEISSALRAVLDPPGLNIIQSNGAAATQTVPHLHVHLVPRYEGDDVGKIWPLCSSIAEQDTARVVADLRASLARQ